MTTSPAFARDTVEFSAGILLGALVGAALSRTLAHPAQGSEPSEQEEPPSSRILESVLDRLKRFRAGPSGQS